MLGTITLIVGGAVASAALFLWVYAERGRLLRSSTRKMLREYGFKNILNFKALHSYIYLHWTGQYINTLLNRILPKLDKQGSKHWADTYHAKIITHEQARAIVTLHKNIPLRDLEQIIPYRTARDLVLSGTPDLAAHECPCRHTRANPCTPTQVCLLIGQPFVDFMVEHSPARSRRLTQAEALELLKQEHEKGHLHSAWFKDVMLNRFYNICNCCKCCCGGIETMMKYGAPMLASSGYIAQVDRSRCEACGKCATVCPFGAVAVETTPVVKWERCMGCGVCESQCPHQAMSLVRDEKKGLPFDVRFIA